MRPTNALFLFCAACACIALAAATAPRKSILRGVGNYEGLGLSMGDGGRRLSQASADLPETKCFWDEVKGACLISKDTAMDILGGIADSDMKTMASRVTDCNYTPTADECATKDGCVWGNSTLVCEYKFDHTDEDNFHNCIGDNAVFIEMSPAFKICKSSAPNKDACNVTPTCTWDEELSACEFDVWKFMTGVPAEGLKSPIPKGIHELVESRSEEIASQLKAESITDGDEILKFKPTPFVCPVGVDMVVCIVAEVADHLTLVREFCESKKSSDGTCNPDEYELCSEECLPSPETLKDVQESQAAAYLNLVEDPTSQLILDQQIKCLLQNEPDCNKDSNCFYDTEQEVCDVKPAIVLRHLSKHPVNKQNPHCEVVQPIFNSGCMEHKESKCAERPNCIWDVDDELCIPGPFALIRGILEDLQGHEDLKIQAAEADEHCYEKKNKGDCI